MRRWLLRIFGLTMLLLCVAFVALGVRSTWRADIVYFQDPQHWGYLKSVAGSISYCRTWVPPHLAENLERRRGFGYANYYRVEAREGWWRREWFTWSRGALFDVPEGRYAQLVLPHWFFALLTAIPAALIGRRVWRDERTRRRHARGLCGACGYDLRASTGQCPECGTGIAVAHASA